MKPKDDHAMELIRLIGEDGRLRRRASLDFETFDRDRLKFIFDALGGGGFDDEDIIKVVDAAAELVFRHLLRSGHLSDIATLRRLSWRAAAIGTSELDLIPPQGMFGSVLPSSLEASFAGRVFVPGHPGITAPSSAAQH